MRKKDRQPPAKTLKGAGVRVVSSGWWDLSSITSGQQSQCVHFSVLLSFLENSAKDNVLGGNPGRFQAMPQFGINYLKFPKKEAMSPQPPSSPSVASRRGSACHIPV